MAPCRLPLLQYAEASEAVAAGDGGAAASYRAAAGYTTSSQAEASALQTAAAESVRVSILLWEASRAAEGFSGRSLRKLPLQAHASHGAVLMRRALRASAAAAAAAAAVGVSPLGSNAGGFGPQWPGTSTGAASLGGAVAVPTGNAGGGVPIDTPSFVEALHATIRSEQEARARFASG